MRLNGISDNHLPIEGLSVTRCTVDLFAFGLLLTPPENALVRDNGAQLSVTVPFECQVGGVTFECDPERDPEGLGPALGLLRKTVEAAFIDEADALTITFGETARLTVPRDADYESWSLNGPHGTLIVAGPGDRLSVFPPPSNG